MNVLPAAIVSELHALFRQGVGVRASARRLGISKITASKYLNQFPDAKCPCGKNIRHRGWCRHRVALSQKRQNFLSRFVQLRHETIEHWLQYSVTFETRIRRAFGHLKETRKEALVQLAAPTTGKGVEFDEEGHAQLVQTVDATQDNSKVLLLKRLAGLHPSVRKLCESVIDGATLDQAAVEAGISPEQMHVLLPRLKTFLLPILETAA